MKIASFIAPILCWIVLLSTASAQSMETYQQQKKVEKSEPNRFLKGESMEKTDQLGRYYRRAFSDKQSKTGSLFQSRKELTGTQDQMNVQMIAIEGPIDPVQYRLGPSDMLSIGIWGDMPASLTAVVTPEASVLIPTVGEISVKGKTLQAAKESIAKEVQRRYSRANVTVTLLAPRSFVVHVSGVVRTPGAYEAGAMDRAERIIALAAAELKQTEPAKKTQYLEDPEHNQTFESVDAGTRPVMSLRNIHIIRGGETLGVDLLRYYAVGENQCNPMLLDGDVIVVPSEQLENNTVGITGAVRLPGSFEYRRGDSLGLMIRIAQGFKERAVVDSIDVLRLAPDGSAIEHIVVDGNRVMKGEIDLALEPNDKVLVRERRVVVMTASVTIKGEVQRPGSYPVTLQNTTVSQVLGLAGGFAEHASPAEVMIIRKDPNTDLDPARSVPDYARLTDLRLSDMNKEEREYFTLEAALRRNTVAFDAHRLFIEHKSDADVTLRDGDEILVPSTQNTVYVFGQVARPGHVSYMPGMKVEYYISHAGQVSDAAVEGDIKIIKAGSRNWVDPGDTAIEPGDAVWVPRVHERDFFFYFTSIRDLLQASVSIATVYLLIKQINNK